jgi:hypothetical protein
MQNKFLRTFAISGVLLGVFGVFAASIAFGMTRDEFEYNVSGYPLTNWLCEEGALPIRDTYLPATEGKESPTLRKRWVHKRGQFGQYDYSEEETYRNYYSGSAGLKGPEYKACRRCNKKMGMLRESAPTISFKWDGTVRVMELKWKTDLLHGKGQVCGKYRPGPSDSLKTLWDLAYPRERRGAEPFEWVLKKLWDTTTDEASQNTTIAESSDYTAYESTPLRATGLKVAHDHRSSSCCCCIIM